MSRQAQVASIEALRSFRAALQEYNEIVREALISLQTEVQRGRDWCECDRMPYWQAEVHTAQEALVEALNRLERKRLSFDPNDTPSCHEEEAAVQRIRHRLRYAEGKVQVTRRWLQRIRYETDQFRNLLAKLQDLADNELPRAVAALGRRLQALDKYTQTPPPAAGAAPPITETPPSN